MKRLVATVGALAAIFTGSGGCGPRVKRDADQSQIRYQLAADYFRGQRVEAAMEELRRALELDPENADAYNLLGLIALAQGAEYQRQTQVSACLRGGDADSVLRDATAKFREAGERLRKAVALRPDFAEAWNNLAVAALNLGSYDEAARAAENALKDVTYPSPELARANLGWALYQQKNLNGAWKALHESVARAPGFCVGRFRLAKVYADRGQASEAAEQIEAVVSNPACPIQEAFFLGGVARLNRHDDAGARALFDRCIALAPRACLAGECKRYAEMIH